MSRRIFWPAPAVLYVMAIFLAACSSSSQPRVSVSSPSNGSEFSEGQIIPIQSISTDANGITRVEVFIDGFILYADTPPKPQPEFSTTQNWQATKGSHIISVRAFNTAGVASEPAMLRVAIVPVVNSQLDSTLVPDSPTPSPPATPTITPTVVLTPIATTPPPTATPVPPPVSSANTGSSGSGSRAPAPSNIDPGIPLIPAKSVPTSAPLVSPRPPANPSPVSPPPSPNGSPSQSGGNGGKGGANPGGNGNGNGNGHGGGNGHGKGPKNN